MTETYNVYRDGKLIKEGLTEKTFKDSGLTANTKYSYQISAVIGEVESELSAKLDVTTAAIAVTGVSLNKTTASVEIGKTETLTATVAPENATNKSVSWSSGDTKVATVSAGKVTAVAAGESVITVKTADGSKTATCTVTVTEPEAPEEE